MNALSWNMELEEWAGNWAATCQTSHRPTKVMKDGSNFGENMAWTWNS